LSPKLSGSTRPLIDLKPGGLFPVGKAAREEADHSRVSSAKIKNEWSCTSRLLTSLQGLTFYRITRICNILSKNYTVSKLNKMSLLKTLKEEELFLFTP
jgi:hypothetical protein